MAEKNINSSTKHSNLRREDIYFEETKQRKIERIKKLGCTHYIDDLYSIVEMLNGTQIKAIHYTNDAQSKANYRMKTGAIWNQ